MMEIKIVDKEDKSIWGVVDLDEFMFGNFEVNFNEGSQLPRNDLMYYKDDYEYFIRLDKKDRWKKIKLRDFYF